MLNSFFPAHGLCHYATDDNIVIIDSNGPFNLEFFKEMHADLIQYVTENVDYRNFAILLIMRGNTLALPDGLAYHEVHVAKGTAKAIAVSLLETGVSELIVVNRTRARAEKLSINLDGKVSVIDWDERSEQLGEIQLLVNSTTLGMQGQPQLDLVLDALPRDAT